ncbi:uncharacterized protein METZ01_LOCUS317487, partial [marine metagenome]
MKWEYNEPHTNAIYSTIKYNDSHCCHEYSQCLFVLDLYNIMFIS